MSRFRTASVRGLTLAVTLMVLAVIFVLAVGISALCQHMLTVGLADTRKAAAWYAANAGLQLAVTDLSYDPAWSAGYDQHVLPANTGSYSVLVTNNLSSGSSTLLIADAMSIPLPFGGVTVPSGSAYIVSSGYDRVPPVTSTAVLGGGVAQSRVAAMLTYTNLFPLAACASLEVTGGSSIDSYDSRIGYDRSRGPSAVVKALSTSETGTRAVSLSGGSRIYGGVQVGMGGNPSRCITVTGNSAITGARTTETRVLYGASGVPPSSLLNTATRSYFASPYTHSLSPGRYGPLVVSGPLSLAPGEYYFDSITVYSHGTICVSDDGVVDIYTPGAVAFHTDDAVRNSSMRPEYLNFYVVPPTSTVQPANVRLVKSPPEVLISGGNSRSCYTLTAPQCSVTLQGGDDFYGGIVGRTIRIKGTDAHLDLHLSTLARYNGMVMSGWSKL